MRPIPAPDRPFTARPFARRLWAGRAALDWRLVALALACLVAIALVPPLFRSAALAAALAALVLAPMPAGTRGVTFAAMTGFATGATAILSFVVPIFQAPVTAEFHWSQTGYAFLITIATAILIVISPPVGRLFDRHGVRPFALGSTACVGLVLIALSRLDGSLTHLYAAFALVQLLGVGISSIAFSRVITRWFDKRRGQAFGAAMAGVGIGGAILSALTQQGIETLGWRGAFVALGALLLLVTLPVMAIWLRESPEDVGLSRDGLPPETKTPEIGAVTAEPARPFGLTAAQSRRRPVFWRMMATFFVMSLGTGGVMLQLIPILTGQGISAERAAVIQGLLGLALIVGPAVAGAMMDRLFAPHVAALLVLFPMTGTALLALGGTGWTASLAAMSLGMAAGAEVNFIAYLVTRYFGTRAYSENFGWLYAAFGLGAGSAPLITALSTDLLHSARPALCFYVGTFALASLLLARLGAYPDDLDREEWADQPPTR